MTPAGSLLAARGLRKAYGRTPALDGADFSIHPGEVVAVLGPSGSGKSTLLHCLAGIVRPDSGTVHYDGHELTALSDARRSALRRGDFGFVFQFGQLVPELTCLENVALPLRSGGQGQRVAVARAMAARPRVLFADEPTGALDSLNGERVMGLLTDAARDTHAAVVLVTHEARVAAYSDREVVVRDGTAREMAGSA